MAWLVALLMLCLLVGTTALVSFLVFYVQFCKSEEKQWRDRILGLFRAAQKTADVEKERLKRLTTDRDQESQSLTREALRSYLCGISVGELEAYSAIGPSTVAKPNSAGYRHLAALLGAHIHIHAPGQHGMEDLA